jgi:hypothetical protein
MLKVFAWILILCLSCIASAEAATCRMIDHQTVCIVDIQRSAKNYWEYRVTLSMDHILQPTKIYNCRDRHITQPNQTRVKFSTDDFSQAICRLYKPLPLPQMTAPR